MAGIYGAGGEDAGDNPILKDMVESQGGKMFTSSSPDGTTLGGDGDDTIINYLLEGYNKKRGIKIYGYSRGGNAAIRITNRLGAMGINVFELITFDPHSLSDATTFELKYNNVAYAANFYQRNPRTGGKYGWWGKNPYWGSPVKSSFIDVYQINATHLHYKGDYVNHLNIIRYVKAIHESGTF